MAEYETSGLNQRQFCESRSLSLATLSRTRKQGEKPAPRLLRAIHQPNGEGASKLMIIRSFGAGDGTRTRDVQLGKLAFYH